jgi:hypothetical protein
MLRTALIMAVITFPLKGWALWRASQGKQKAWYIVMFLINTFGILELIYLFYFSKPAPKEYKTNHCSHILLLD